MSYTLTLTTDQRPALPSIIDYAELIAKHLPEPLVRLADMEQLERRCEEINLSMPRFKEETPLVLKTERARRAAFQMQAH
ncbi:hypothetical protein [Hymenobacter sp.]|jgi:hypothetical protein|uniref:hypothetical protein n=1 Tax=Hymenobacter sp. TaxID=1898978 RepID=UPI002ED799E4